MHVDCFLPATTLLRALETRAISALELLELHIQRIEHYDQLLNSVVVRDFNAARQVAAEIDAMRPTNDHGSFRGLPITVKEGIHVRGLPLTGGLPERRGAIASADAPPVAHARANGAVIFGKTNTPALSKGFQCSNPLFGRTNNPWNLERTPGGSSGGSAAAVAAGLSPLDVASDSGGSIRVPAAFCGVYGHKSSETAIARSGYFPAPSQPLPVSILSVRGPIARTADDLEFALDTLAGPELGEEPAWRITIPPARHAALADYRVAILPIPDWLPVDQAILSAISAIAGALGRIGAVVRQAQPDGLGDLRDFHKLRLRIAGALEVPAQERSAVVAQLRATNDEFDAVRATGVEASASDYVGWFREREQYRAAFRSFFEEWDVLIAPIVMVPAYRHSIERHWSTAIIGQPYVESMITVDDARIRYWLQGVYPTLANLSGNPATTFPVGTTADGLPIGIQAIGPYLEDRTSIRFASLLAREIGGYEQPPAYAIRNHVA